MNKSAKLLEYRTAILEAIEAVNGRDYVLEFTGDDQRLISCVAHYFMIADISPTEFGLQPNGSCPAMFAFDVIRVLTNEMELNLPI